MTMPQTQFSFSKLFDELARSGESAYMPYVCIGDPNLEFSEKLVTTLAAAGADAFEIGIPFSDPMADGPVIQTASERALKAGSNAKQVLAFVKRLRDSGIKTPFALMTYYNVLYHYDLDDFCKDAAAAGANGFIIPDVPYEEDAPLKTAASKYGLDVISFVTPITTDNRMKSTLASASGFVYAVAVLGVTGARDAFANTTAELIVRTKQATRVPVAVGFGIAKPEHVTAAVAAGADAVIEGSQLIKMYASHLTNGAFTPESEATALSELFEHAKAMKQCTRRTASTPVSTFVPSQTSRTVNAFALSKDPTEQILGNLVETPFELDGERYVSFEAFYRAIQCPEGSELRKEVAGLSGMDSYNARKRIPEAPTFTYRGQTIAIGSPEEKALLVRGLREKFAQNPNAAALLSGTGDALIVHNPTKPDGSPVPDSKRFPKALFTQTLMEIRRELQTRGRVWVG